MLTLTAIKQVIYAGDSELKAEKQEEEVGGACEKETGPRVCAELETRDSGSSHIHPKTVGLLCDQILSSCNSVCNSACSSFCLLQVALGHV